MHIAYSALNQTSTPNQSNSQATQNDIMLRYQAYQATCSKYSSQIAQIQKYLPGWMPAFR
ncbi:hypothetical protein BH09BAC6_BH09BAC6_18380 [soil metagenome]|jgi:hypothetical protein